jgi:hypothetical protein
MMNDALLSGSLDIVSGAYWYQGPDFKKKHRIGEVQAAGEYFDDFSTIPLDVNGDGWMDYITGGWWGNTIRWRENSRDPSKEWPEHVIAETGNVESTRAWDVDGDGDADVVRGDTWFENRDGKGGDWLAHSDIPFGRVGPFGKCVRTAVADLDGDGKLEIIMADADGVEVDGDQVMTMCATDMMKEKRLARNTLVTTVMSNVGLDQAIKRAGGKVVRTQVGDRYVVEEMLRGKPHHFTRTVLATAEWFPALSRAI